MFYYACSWTFKSSQIRTINLRSCLTNTFHVYKLTWDVKEPTHYSKRVGHEVPTVVAVLCESMGGFGSGNLPSRGPCVLLRITCLWANS